MINISDFKIIIENPKGSYKSFETEGDTVWSTYPLKGVTYPVDYGYIEGYRGEDHANLDIFIGTGDLRGYICVWRLDVPIETKFFVQVTDLEFEAIKKAFSPVLLEAQILNDKDFIEKIKKFKVI